MHGDQADFIPRLQECFIKYKSINVIHVMQHTNRIKAKNHIITLIDEEKLRY
jgi:hypothetical protein